MTQTIVEIKSNFGNDKVKMKIYSQKPLSEFEKKYVNSLRRDELFQYGKIKNWNVVDISEWE